MLRNYTPINAETQWATEIREREPGYVELSYQVVPFTANPLPKEKPMRFKRLGVMTDGIVFADDIPETTETPSWQKTVAISFSFRGDDSVLAEQIRSLYTPLGKKSELTEEEAQRVRAFIDANVATLDMQPVRG